MSTFTRLSLFLTLITLGAHCLSANDAATHSEEDSRRIIGIGGAATEIVYALGAGDEVVAVDLSSTYPREVMSLPKVGYIRAISPEGVLSMNPGLVVTTESMGPPAAKEAMKQVSVPVVWCPEPESPEALYEGIALVGEALAQEEAAQALVAQIQAQLAAVSAGTATWSEKPKVLFFLQPPSMNRAGMAAGNDTRADELIKLSGGQNALVGVTKYQPITAESILAAQPDVILMGSAAGHGASQGNVDYLVNLPALQSVPAVKNGQVLIVPMDDLSFGPRLGQAAKSWSGTFAKSVPPAK